MVEWLALFGHRCFLLNLQMFLTSQAEEAKKAGVVFCLLVAGLAFGGGYALLLALPFLFYALSVVTNYLAFPKVTKDLYSGG